MREEEKEKEGERGGNGNGNGNSQFTYEIDACSQSGKFVSTRPCYDCHGKHGILFDHCRTTQLIS